MQATWRKRLLFSLAFGALVFIGFTVWADAGKLAAAFARFNWWMVPVILACSSVNYIFRYWKWEYYTIQLGIQPERKKNIIIFFTAFIMAVTPGKFGEVLKSYLLKQVNNTQIRISAPIILAERLTDFLGLILLILAGAYVFDIGRTAVISFAVFFTALTILLGWRRGSLGIISACRHLPVAKRFVPQALTAYESIYILIRPKTLMIAVVLSVISWSFECLGFWIILNEFQAPPTMLKATFIYAFSTIVGALTMLPGGLGTTEGSLTGLSILAGVPKDVAVAATFIIRVATLWFAVLIGIIVTFAFQHVLHVRIDSIDLSSIKTQEA